MGLLSWFSKPTPPDYETVLSRYASDISDAKIHLSEIRLRERRSALLVNAYGLALWAIWTGLWYVRGLPLGLLGWESHSMEVKAVGVGGVMIGPLFIYGLNRLLHLYFRRQRNAEETNLRKLLAEQKKQVDAIKKATNYDSTRKLIERYDEAGQQFGMGSPIQQPSNPSTPVRRGTAQNSPASQRPSGSTSAVGQGQGIVGSPRAPGHLAGIAGTPGFGPGTPIPVPEGFAPDQVAALHMQMQAIQPVLPTPEKKWYDRVVDSILGDDPSQATQSKYALVCGECFRHNGLVGSKYEWERMQWLCPRCNHMNPSPLSRLNHPQLAASNHGVPQTPSSPSPLDPANTMASPTPAQRGKAAVAASPRPRRALGEKGTPRTSRLGQEVMTARHDAEEDDEGESDGQMDIDGS